MFQKISSASCTTELVTLHVYEYSYMHPIHDACPCFLDDRDIEWTHAVLRTCSLSTSTSQLSISSVIFSSLAATSSQVRLFYPSHPLRPQQDSEHPGFSFSRSHSSNRYGHGVQYCIEVTH